MFTRTMRISFIAALIGAAVSVATARETTAPDILFISGDDLGNYLGCYGDPYAKTPRMDSIAKEGVQFENAWVTQASCSPSRSSMLTGMYPHNNGQIGLAHRGFSMSKEWPSIPSLLNDAGYYTGLIGKLHVKPESAFPFQFKWDAPGQVNRSPKAIAEQTDKFLEQAGDKPIFLNASFHDPHRPFIRQVDGSPANPVSKEDVKLLPFMKGLEDVPGLEDEVAGYYNCIARMDDCVGAVLDRLEKAGRLENTLILLVGDHGAPFGRGKVTCLNPGLRIPFLVKWPGVSQSGNKSNALVSTIDILPTFLDAAGVKEPSDLPGVSLRNAVSNASAKTRDYMFAEFTAHLPNDYYPRLSVRNERYQLIHNLMGGTPNPTKGIEGLAEREAVADTDVGTSEARKAIQTYVNPPEFELYDLEKDPDNFVNLAGKPELKETQERLLAELQKWRQQTDDPMLKKGEIKRLSDHITATLDMSYTGVPKDREKNAEPGRQKKKGKGKKKDE